MADNKRSIASVYVTVIPETSRIAEKIAAEFKKVDSEVRQAAGRWKREIDQELRGVSDVDVDADTSKAKAEVKALDREIEGRTRKVKVDVDASALNRVLGGGSGGALGGAVKLNASVVGIGLLPAAATAITNVAGAAQQLAGAGLALPGAFAGIASSVGVATLGMSGMKDAVEAVNKAADGTQASVDAANKALAGLAPNAADTVKTVVGLKGTFDDLQHIAGQNMFAGVSGGLKELVGQLLPAATRGIDSISRGLNENLLQAMQSLGSDSSQGFLDRILGNTGDAQSRLTAAIDPIIHAVGTLTAAGSDTLPRLADALGNVAQRFDKFITAADGDGRLSKWITEGLDGFTNLGNTLLNLGTSFTAITKAAGGGAGLLGTLEQASGKLSEFLNSTAGQEKLKQFFRDGRDMLGRLKDIAVELGPILAGAFNAAHTAAGLWLPVIQNILTTINSIPGGAQAVVTAFVAWRTISGVSSLATSLNNIATLLKVTLPGAAATGAGSITTALAGVTVPAWLSYLVAGGSVASVGHGLSQAHDMGLSPEVTTRFPHLANPRAGAQGAPGSGSIPSDTLARKNDLPWNTSTGARAGAPLVGSPAPAFDWGSQSPATQALPPPAVNVPPVTQFSAPAVTEPSGSSSSGHVENTGGTLVPNAQRVRDIVMSQFPEVTDIGGWRAPDGFNEHSSGEALDIMVGSNKELGDRINTFLLQNADALGINYDLWRQTQWNPDGTRSPMEDRGSPTQNHMDHVHARVKPGTATPMQTLYDSQTNLPGASTGPMDYSDDKTVRNAQQHVDDTASTVTRAQMRLDEVNSKATSTALQRKTAEDALTKAQREHKDAIDDLATAQDKFNQKQANGKTAGGGNSAMSNLGGDLVGGIAEALGFDGTLFKNPAEFGLFKLLGAFSKLKVNLPDAVKGGDGASLPGFGGGEGGDGGLINDIMSFIPQPFGDVNIGSPQGLPAPGDQFTPGGGNGVVLPASQFLPGAQPANGAASPGPGNNIDNRSIIDMRGANFAGNSDLTEHLQGMRTAQARTRSPLRNLP